MIKIEKVNNSIYVEFGFMVIDEKNKENQVFYKCPHKVMIRNNNISAQDINKEVVSALRKVIDSSLKDLEYCVKHQQNPDYLLQIQDGGKEGFEFTNNNNW